MVGTGKAYAKSKCYLAAATSLTFLKHIRPPASIAFYVLQCDATTALVAPSLSALHAQYTAVRLRHMPVRPCLTCTASPCE
jgi:hypothetical protein